jgi:hypothetical protein
MKLVPFTTAISAMPPESRLPALMFIALTIAGYVAYMQLSSDIVILRTDLRVCNESRISRLETDIAIRDSQQVKLLQIIEQNSSLLKKIERKVCNQ